MVFRIFSKKPAEKSWETRRYRYGEKGFSPRGLNSLTQAHRKSETRLERDGSSLVVVNKPFKTKPVENRVYAGLNGIGYGKREYITKKTYHEEGINSSQGLYIKAGKRDGLSMTIDRDTLNKLKPKKISL